MARQFEDPRLVVASHNEGKVREIGDLLAPLGRDVVSAKELDLPEPEETGDTFVANALLKGRAPATPRCSCPARSSRMAETQSLSL